MLTTSYLCFCIQCHDVKNIYPTKHRIINTHEEKREKLWLFEKKSVPLHPLLAFPLWNAGLNLRIV